jgi:hypothetical protein
MRGTGRGNEGWLNRLSVNVELERFLLASIVTGYVDFETVEHVLEVNDFSLEKHHRLYSRMRRQQGAIRNASVPGLRDRVGELNFMTQNADEPIAEKFSEKRKRGRPTVDDGLIDQAQIGLGAHTRRGSSTGGI